MKKNIFYPMESNLESHEKIQEFPNIWKQCISNNPKFKEEIKRC